MIGAAITGIAWGYKSYATGRGITGVGTGGALTASRAYRAVAEHVAGLKVGWVIAIETCSRRWRAIVGALLAVSDWTPKGIT